MKDIHTKYTKVFVCLAATTIGISSPVFASSAWVGNANYSQAPGADGTESTANNFSQYDFGAGALLLKFTPSTTGGVSGSFSGYYQTKIDDHTGAGGGLSLTDLKTNGAAGDGSGFELTLKANYSGFYSKSTDDFGITTTSFSNITGDTNIYFDSTPDFNFAADTGFGSDTDVNVDTSILSATINGGGGSFSNTFAVGGERLDLIISGEFDGYDKSVFEPDTINGGSVGFLLKLNMSENSIYNEIVNGNNTVMGQVYNAPNSDLLLEGNGLLELTAVPLPASVWFLGSSLVGLISFAKRKKS